MKNPNIICTLGTTTDDKTRIENMIKYGMTCARINTAYSTFEKYSSRINMIKSINPDIKIMMDIKGPQVRLEADISYRISKNDIFYFGFNDESIHFNKQFYDDVNIGDIILIENGTIQTSVLKKERNRLEVKIDYPGAGIIHKSMGVNLPGKYLDVEKLSEKDKEAIDFSVKNNLDYIALSFTRTFEDIKNCNDFIQSAKEKYSSTRDIGIEIKIEDKYGVSNLQDMIDKSKKENIPLSVMVARGDLFVEFNKLKLPIIQQYIIDTCKQNNVPITVGTGVINSMINSVSPTRAEVNDVYNILKQDVDAIMLSGETSNAYDPVLSVRVLHDIIKNSLEYDINGQKSI